MIVLDTNVISELFRPAPESRVMAWMEQVTGDDLFTTVITRAELLLGLHCMPDGRRKMHLSQGIARIFDSRLAGHVLVFDSSAADAYVAIAAARRSKGRPVSQSDAMIAGIVHAHDATLATRNTHDFENCGIALIDPWH